VFPNPTAGEIHIEIPQSFNTDIREVKVLNAQGSVIGSVELHWDGRKGFGKYSLMNYPAGLYSVTFYGELQRHQFKVVKK
jgi:hypothetical protein